MVIQRDRRILLVSRCALLVMTAACVLMSAPVSATSPPQADLSISKTDTVDPVLAGGPLTYIVEVHNQGPDSAPNVVVTDTLPAGVTLVSTTGCVEDPNGIPTCTLGTLASSSGDSYAINLTVDAGTSGTISNQVSVVSDVIDPNAANDSSTEETTVNQPSANLSISKTDTLDPVLAGGPLTYIVEVSNLGPDSAPNVVVTDTLPAGVTLVNTTGCVEDPNGVPTCTLGTLASSSGDSYAINLTVDAGTSGTISNQVSVVSDVTDPNTVNNSFTEETTVNQPAADLSVSIADIPDPVMAGDALTYIVEFSNFGPDTAPNVVVTDTLPAGVAFVSTTGCAEDPNGVPTCTLGTFGDSSGDSYVINVTVDPGASGILTNQASVSSDVADPNTSNNSRSEDTNVIANTPTQTATPTPTPKLPDGAGCTSGNECVSDLCVDTVCCDTECDEDLQSCNLPGSEGTCTAITAPAPATSTNTLLGIVAMLIAVAGLSIARGRAF